MVRKQMLWILILLGGTTYHLVKMFFVIQGGRACATFLVEEGHLGRLTAVLLTVIATAIIIVVDGAVFPFWLRLLKPAQLQREEDDSWSG